ncbi:MAG: hypothetical protein D3908_10885 [Candidatus Electrothrix sp. AUS4]|nr:hypothetical protein [Candidatus Electrothrix sp. AUS4]
MQKKWRILWINSLVSLVSLVSSSMIMLAGYHYSLGLLFNIFAPLTGGFMVAYLVLFFIEDGGTLYLVQTFWYSLLLGTTVALLVAVGFVCAISQHYLFFTRMSM